jgi:peroxiredoxin
MAKMFKQMGKGGLEAKMMRGGLGAMGVEAAVWALNSGLTQMQKNGQDSMTTLQDQLDEITAQTRTLVQPERLAIGERAVEELFRAGSEDRILPIGATAPAFALPDFSGRIVRSTDLLALGPLIVNFFRGRWCPYCVTELEAWRDLYPALRERGALVVGISPQTQRQSDFTASQHAIPFPLLTDAGCAVAEQFGLVWTAPDYLRATTAASSSTSPSSMATKSWKLPLPATYVLSPDGKVLYAEAHADFRVRPEPEEADRALPHFPAESGGNRTTAIGSRFVAVLQIENSQLIPAAVRILQASPDPWAASSAPAASMPPEPATGHTPRRPPGPAQLAPAALPSA